MKKAKFRFDRTLLAAVAAAVFVVPAAQAGPVDMGKNVKNVKEPFEGCDPLLNLLVSKGVLSTEEASQVQGELEDARCGNAVVKVKESWVDKMTLFGDIRMRYEWKEFQNGHDNERSFNRAGGDQDVQRSLKGESSRVRYRLRFGFIGKIGDDFEFGLRLASGGEGIESTNETFGDGFRYDPITINWVYFKYAPVDWATVYLGKYDVEKLIYTTDMLWDSDVTSEGATEQFTLEMGNATLFANVVQWVFADVSETNDDIGDSGDGFNQIDQDDGWLFGGQIGAQYDFDPKKHYMKGAVGYWYYSNADDVQGGNSPSQGMNLGGEYQLLDAIAEYNFTVAKLPLKLYGHFIWNSAPAPDRIVVHVNDGSDTDPTERYDTRNSVDEDSRPEGRGKDFADDIAWRVGLKVGNAKKKGQWELNGFYEQVGNHSVPELWNDSDMANGFVNHSGFGLKAKYMFTDWWELGVTYLDADWLDADIAQEFDLGDEAQNRTVQVDTIVKW